MLVSCDFSSAMVAKLGANYEPADFCWVPGNKFVLEKEVDYCEGGGEDKLKHRCDLEQVVRASTNGEAFRKLVYGCRANNELLPFADEIFTAYMAPLSAMLVNNPLRQFREAYRVLQKGCTAVFTIWGRRENSLMIVLLDDVILRHAPPQMQEEDAAASSNFDLSSGKRFAVEQTLRQIGFSQVKMWYQPQNVLFRTGEEYVMFWEAKFKRLCAKAG